MSVSFFKKITVAICSAFSLLVAQASQKNPETSFQSDTLADIITADIALHRGMPLIAYQYYQEVVQRTKNPDIAALSWKAAVQTNNNELLLNAAHQWIKTDSASEVPHQTILLNAVQKGQQKEFLNELSFIYQKSENKHESVSRITQMLAHIPNLPPFVERGLEPYWEKVAHQPQVLRSIGIFRQAQKNTPEACRALIRAYELAPNDENIVATAAEICWQHDKKQSEKFLVRFLKKNPNNAPLTLLYGQLLTKTARSDLALVEIKKAVRIAPQEPSILLNAGLLAFDCKAYDLTEDYLNQYIDNILRSTPEADISSNEVWTRLADAAHLAGKHDKEAFYLSKLSNGPLAPEARIREANALAESNHIDEAMTLLDQARETYSEDAAAFLTAKAKLLVAHNRSAEALSLMQNELQCDPNNVTTLYDAAMTAINLDRMTLAEDYLSKILSLSPDHVRANNALGYIWVIKDKKLPQARRLIEHAYQLAPEDPYILDSMGWLCFKEGKFEQATEFTIASLNKLFDIEVAGHLVEILYRNGHEKEALELYLSLRNKSQNDPRVIELGKKLGLEN